MSESFDLDLPKATASAVTPTTSTLAATTADNSLISPSAIDTKPGFIHAHVPGTTTAAIDVDATTPSTAVISTAAVSNTTPPACTEQEAANGDLDENNSQIYNRFSFQFPYDSGLQEDEDLYLETRMLDLKHQASSSPDQTKEEVYIKKAKQDNKTSGVDSPAAIVQGPTESQSSNPLVSPAPGPKQASSSSSDVEQAQRHQDLDQGLLDDAFLFSPNPPSPQLTAPVAAPKLVQHPAAAAQNTLSRSSSRSSFHVLTKDLDSYFENESEDEIAPTQSRNLFKGEQDKQIVDDQKNGEARLSTATTTASLQAAAVSSRLSGTLTTEPVSVLPVHDIGNTRPPASPPTLQRISLSSLASPIAQLQSPIAGSPIKRKPLSASASALAIRFSNPPVRKSLDKGNNVISPKLQPSVAFFQPQSLDQSLDSLDSFPLPPSVRTSKENVCEEHSKKLIASQGALDSSRSSLQNPVDTADLNTHPATALTTVPHSRNTSVSSSASKEQGVNETRLSQKEEEEEEEEEEEQETSFGLPNIRPGYLEETQPQERYEPQGPYHHPFSPVTASQQFPYEIAPNTSSKSYHDFAYEEERESRLTLSYHQIDTIDEVTEPETSPKYRDSFQSSVYSLPTAGYASLDDREPVSRKLGPAFEVKHFTYPTRPTSTPDTSQLSAYPESPPPLPPKPEDRRLSFNTPPIPPPKPGATSAQTATITSHADPGLSSPILPLHSTAELNKPLPRSPNQPNLDQGELFVWTPGADSPTNSAFSSIPSPVSPQRTFSTDDTAEAPAVSGTYTTPKNIPAHVLAQQDAIKYLEDLQTPPTTKGLTSTTTTGSSGHEISDMEDELKAISAELAASIRREMDLEDIVDKLQSEVTNSAQSSNKRTSDYFSDSGYSSTKFSEYDQSREEIERIQRKADQEKARIRLELTTKVQEERDKRHHLDLQIQELSAKAIRHNESTQISAADNSRLKELENQCEDLRRRLSDEREMKDNFEHLLTALKGELEVTSNERDNLRDEVVPELRARVEGLEVQNAEMSTMSYESSKIQQELKALRDENDNLRNSKFESEMKTRVTSLTRSSSVASSFKLQKAPMGLSRSNTVKGSEKATSMESKDALLERLKDVEAQRDALHRALKSLLERQEFQNRESEKKIKSLEILQSRLLEGSPRKAGYEKEIENLKLEITVLRRRAEEAVEQKWRVENGLRGLKTDLDRAEAEISSLKTLLQANDILIPPAFNMASSASMTTPESTSVVSSESLNKALTDLQEAYQESLIRIRSLEAASTDEKTVAAIQRLETALANMTADRNVARIEADSLRVQAMNVSASQAEHIKSEQVLSEQLQSSAQRIETLAAQVSEQLSLNSDLRQRLLDTVSRGEADRQANVSWVNQLQEKLRVMEEQLNAAQTATDERIAIYEEEIASLRMAQSSQLQRIGSPISGGGLRSPGMRSPGLRSPFLTGAPDRAASPLTSPMFPRSPRSPRMVNSKSFEDEAERTRLRNRVQELEKALSEAETEMQNIVGKISEAQIQVLTLQEERDAALRETRKVQRALEEEMAQAKRLAA